MNVFGGDAVVKGRVGVSDGFVGSGRDAERVGFFVRGLDPVLQTLLQEELEEHAVELHGHAWHLSLAIALRKFLCLQKPEMIRIMINS